MYDTCDLPDPSIVNMRDDRDNACVIPIDKQVQPGDVNIHMSTLPGDVIPNIVKNYNYVNHIEYIPLLVILLLFVLWWYFK